MDDLYDARSNDKSETLVLHFQVKTSVMNFYCVIPAEAFTFILVRNLLSKCLKNKLPSKKKEKKRKRRKILKMRTPGMFPRDFCSYDERILFLFLRWMRVNLFFFLSSKSVAFLFWTLHSPLDLLFVSCGAYGMLIETRCR